MISYFLATIYPALKRVYKAHITYEALGAPGITIRKTKFLSSKSAE